MRNRVVQIIPAKPPRVPRQEELPIKNCKKCTYKEIDSGGHCFMFMEEPRGIRCGQFQSKN